MSMKQLIVPWGSPPWPEEHTLDTRKPFWYNMGEERRH